MILFLLFNYRNSGKKEDPCPGMNRYSMKWIVAQPKLGDFIYKIPNSGPYGKSVVV
jgi:hypothetical protein